jgi:hypothetical protein
MRALASILFLLSLSSCGGPYDGSAIVVFDSGTPTPPTAILPPRGPKDSPPGPYGKDPHETPRRDPNAQLQKSEFMKTGGTVIDTCGGAPCKAIDPGCCEGGGYSPPRAPGMAPGGRMAVRRIQQSGRARRLATDCIPVEYDLHIGVDPQAEDVVGTLKLLSAKLSAPGGGGTRRE